MGWQPAVNFSGSYVCNPKSKLLKPCNTIIIKAMQREHKALSDLWLADVFRERNTPNQISGGEINRISSVSSMGTISLPHKFFVSWKRMMAWAFLKLSTKMTTKNGLRYCELKFFCRALVDQRLGNNHDGYKFGLQGQISEVSVLAPSPTNSMTLDRFLSISLSHL